MTDIPEMQTAAVSDSIWRGEKSRPRIREAFTTGSPPLPKLLPGKSRKMSKLVFWASVQELETLF